jgi:hypothetical protein
MEHVRVGLYSLTKGSYQEAADLAQSGMLPVLQGQEGFIRYGVSEATDGTLISISLWETHDEAEKAQAVIADWVKDNLADRIELQHSYVGDFSFWSGP